MKRKQLIDLKNQIVNVYENSKKQLEEFRSRLPADVVQEIEKNLADLAEWRDKDLSQDDTEKVKESIEKVKQSVMKIGSSLNSQSSKSSESSESESQSQQNENDG